MSKEELTGEYHNDCNILVGEIKKLEAQNVALKKKLEAASMLVDFELQTELEDRLNEIDTKILESTEGGDDE